MSCAIAREWNPWVTLRPRRMTASQVTRPRRRRPVAGRRSVLSIDPPSALYHPGVGLGIVVFFLFLLFQELGDRRTGRAVDGAGRLPVDKGGDPLGLGDRHQVHAVVTGHGRVDAGTGEIAVAECDL